MVGPTCTLYNTNQGYTIILLLDNIARISHILQCSTTRDTSTCAQPQGRHSQQINSTKSIGLPSGEPSQVDSTKSICIRHETISSHLNSVQRSMTRDHTRHLNSVQRSMTHPSHGLSHRSSQLSPQENDLENTHIFLNILEILLILCK